MNGRIPEPARAWAWHTALWALTAAALYGIILIGVWATTVLGPIPGSLILVALVVVAIGTASWWQAGRTRP